MPPAPPPPGVRAPADVVSGSRLGKYEILKRLATGGMAEIFLARVSGLPGFQKMVVIKRILPQLATKSDFIEMFLDEARIAATLQHPNVVQMYDVGVVDGNYFIAMEYLHGEDVRSLCKALYKREERLSLEHALAIIIGVSSGLHYAHEKVGFDGKPLNIIHRDVTPQNIIVTFEGGVKLLDFGIAKASNRFGETRFGTLKGKVPYMSPEQCRGEPLDQRSDIFSLGIMLYELTLGKRLYKGASDFEVLKQIVEGRVTRPSEIDPGYDRSLEEIVMHALEKERDKRFQSVRDMQEQLEELVREARLHTSSIGLARFMRKIFGEKIEAWQEARAQGKSLGEHLEEAVIDDEDLEVIDERDAASEEQAARERNALRAAIEANPLTLEPPPASDDERSVKSSRIHSASLSGLRAPMRSRAPLVLMALGGVLVLGGVAAWKLRPKREAPVVVTSTPPPKVADETPPPKVAGETPPKVKPEDEPPPPAVGIVKIATSPAGATLFLDGKKLEGKSPLTIDRIEAGRDHVILAQLDGHKDAMARFTVAAHEVRAVEAKLTRLHHEHSSHREAPPVTPSVKNATPPKKDEPPPPPVKLEGNGTLVVASSPWVEVSVDGVAKGQTPLSLTLPAGKHTVLLTNGEFKIARTISVMILPNETVRKKLDFSQ